MMNKRSLPLLLGLSVLTGCAHHYKITLINGTQIDTTSKPRLDQGYYYYNDAAGRKGFVPAGRVREIAPASMAKDENAAFKTRPVK